MQPEKLLQRRLLAAISRHDDVLVFECPTGSGYAGSLVKSLCQSCRKVSMGHRISWGLTKGGADLVGVVGDKALWIEVKTPNGVVSPEQIRFAQQVAARGGTVHVCRSVEDAEEAVRRTREDGRQ